MTTTPKGKNLSVEPSRADPSAGDIVEAENRKPNRGGYTPETSPLNSKYINDQKHPLSPSHSKKNISNSREIGMPAHIKTKEKILKGRFSWFITKIPGLSAKQENL